MKKAGIPDESSQPPVFVLTASRSGSTLLRFILDSHPELACPPETHVGGVCGELANFWSVLERARTDGTSLPPDQAQIIAAVRAAIDDAFGHYLRDSGKRRWCDKSPNTFRHARLLIQMYPDAKFICLYRHCMDMIASGIEACPWGLQNFGFEPFAARYPGNNVAAIGSYWLDTVKGIMAFEEANPRRCHRVRYEDLVTAPEETAAAIFAFLGAAQAPGVTQASLQARHAGGPGDQKIWFTDKIRDDSMGRGVQVPAGKLPAPVREDINELLGQLGYRPIDEKWNAVIGRADPRARPQVETGLDSVSRPGTRADEALTAAVRAIEGRIRSRTDDEMRQISAHWPALAGETVRIIVQDADGGHRELLQWAFPAAGTAQPSGSGDRLSGHGRGEPFTIVSDPATFRALLDGNANLRVELRAGRLRHAGTRAGDQTRWLDVRMRAVAAVLGLAPVPAESRDAEGQAARR